MEKNKHTSINIYVRRITGTDKQTEHNTAHQLLRDVLAEDYHIDNPAIGRNGHGKPFLTKHPELHFNLSHCAGLAVCAIGASPLGVDAEPVRTMRPNVLRRAFSPQETAAVTAAASPDEAFFRHWTLKESYVKAVGIGISYPLRDVNFRILEDRIWSNQPNWQFAQFNLEHQWIVSCCFSTKLIAPAEILWK